MLHQNGLLLWFERSRWSMGHFCCLRSGMSCCGSCSCHCHTAAADVSACLAPAALGAEKSHCAAAGPREETLEHCHLRNRVVFHMMSHLRLPGCSQAGLDVFPCHLHSDSCLGRRVCPPGAAAAVAAAIAFGLGWSQSLAGWSRSCRCHGDGCCYWGLSVTKKSYLRPGGRAVASPVSRRRSQILTNESNDSQQGFHLISHNPTAMSYSAS